MKKNEWHETPQHSEWYEDGTGGVLFTLWLMFFLGVLLYRVFCGF